MTTLTGMIFQEDKTWDINSVPINYTHADFIASSPLFVASPLENLGIGVYPLTFKGNVSSRLPFIKRAHNRKILDMRWSPFHFNFLASCAMDGNANVWKIPSPGGFEKGGDNMTKPEQSLPHKKKVFCVRWHPSCEGVLGTACVDKKVRMWDIENSKPQIEITLKKKPLTIAFNPTGNIAYSFSDDKKLRTLDIRDSSPIKNEVACHGSVKGANILFAANKGLVITTGFERNGDRSVRLYDPKKMDKELELHVLNDQSTGVIVSFYDPDLSLMYCAGRGESIIPYFTLKSGKVEQMGTFKSKTPQLGVTMLPKLGLNTLSHEIGRFYRLTPKKAITPVRVIVPKIAEEFQEDLFPETFGSEPFGDANFFFDGDDIEPVKKISLDPTKRKKDLIFCEQFHRKSMQVKKKRSFKVEKKK